MPQVPDVTKVSSFVRTYLRFHHTPLRNTSAIVFHTDDAALPPVNDDTRNSSFQENEPEDLSGRLSSTHAFQLIALHPETLKDWHEDKAPDEEMDPEHARKLAAIRTEMLLRAIRRIDHRK